MQLFEVFFLTDKDTSKINSRLLEISAFVLHSRIYTYTRTDFNMRHISTWHSANTTKLLFEKQCQALWYLEHRVAILLILSEVTAMASSFPFHSCYNQPTLNSMIFILIQKDNLITVCDSHSRTFIILTTFKSSLCILTVNIFAIFILFMTKVPLLVTISINHSILDLAIGLQAAVNQDSVNREIKENIINQISTIFQLIFTGTRDGVRIIILLVKSSKLSFYWHKRWG